MKFDRGILAALGAAALFGLSTPLAKPLAAQGPPLLLAGLLYLGSGLGLAMLLSGARAGWTAAHRLATRGQLACGCSAPRLLAALSVPFCSCTDCA